MRFLFFKNPAKKNGILLLETEGACLCRPISSSMAAMLGNSGNIIIKKFYSGFTLPAKNDKINQAY